MNRVIPVILGVEYDDGATPLDYDELKGLLPTHITTRGELDFLEMENINQAIICSERLKLLIL